MAWYIEELGDLYPNEQIMDFNYGSPDKLPGWLGANLKLIFGAGDHAQIGDVPNIEFFSDYDVFLCWPEPDNPGILRSNVEALTRRYRNQKLLVFIDLSNPGQIKQFTDLFAERFILIDGHVGHTPHLDFNDYSLILAEGGRAIDVYEHAYESLVSANEYEKNLRKSLANGIKSVKRYNMKIYNVKMLRTTPETSSRLIAQMQEIMTKYLAGDEKIISLDVLAQVESEDDMYMKLIQYAIILECLKRIDTVPFTLVATIEFVKRVWKQGSRLELVLTKRSPELFNAIETYRDKFGSNNANVKRADMILAKIKNNIRSGQMSWMTKAKYSTLRKHINAKLKPRVGGKTRKYRRNT